MHEKCKKMIGKGRVDGSFGGAETSNVDAELNKMSAVTKETDLPPKCGMPMAQKSAFSENEKI